MCVTAGDEYSAKWRKINQSSCHLFVMICLIPVWYVHGGSEGGGKEMEGQQGNEGEEMFSRSVCVFVCGRKDRNRASQRDRGGKVCL